MNGKLIYSGLLKHCIVVLFMPLMVSGMWSVLHL